MFHMVYFNNMKRNVGYISCTWGTPQPMDYIDLMLFHYIHKKTLEPSTKKEIKKPELFILLVHCWWSYKLGQNVWRPLHPALKRAEAFKTCRVSNRGNSVRLKSGEPRIPGFSVPGRLGGVTCKPEGAAWGLVKTPPSLRARKKQECTIDRLYFISKMPKKGIN